MESPIGNNIAASFVKAQRQFGPALKKSVNSHFKSKYADLTSCIDAVMDGLNANGIALMQRSFECKDGVMVETTFIHESGEVMESGLFHVPASKHDAMGFGSALTYARRYSLMTACGISSEDDDGVAASPRPESKTTVIKSTVNENQILDLIAAMDETITMDDLLKAYKEAYKAAKNEQEWQAKVIAKKDAKKAMLESK